MATAAEKEIKTDWPAEEGLIGGTTKQTGRVMNLIAEGVLGIKSIVPAKDKVGMT